jgi:hypothetical protein
MADVALGVEKIEYGTYGDGVPPTSWTEISDPIHRGSVVFNFSEPTDFRIEAEESDDPVYVGNVKEDTDYVEFALVSPVAATMETLAGGTTTSDKWEASTAIPEIVKSVKITSKTIGGNYFEYTIVNGKIVARLSQAPGKQQSDLLLVRVYIQAAITDAGAKNTPFIREMKAA